MIMGAVFNKDSKNRVGVGEKSFKSNKNHSSFVPNMVPKIAVHLFEFKGK